MTYDLFSYETVHEILIEKPCGAYRVECLATGGSLGSVGDTLSSSASQPVRHPSSHAVPSVLLQHLPTDGDWKLHRYQQVLNILGVPRRSKFWAVDSPKQTSGFVLHYPSHSLIRSQRWGSHISSGWIRVQAGNTKCSSRRTERLHWELAGFLGHLSTVDMNRMT